MGDATGPDHAAPEAGRASAEEPQPGPALLVASKSWRGTRLILRGRRGDQPKAMGHAGEERSGPVILGTPSENRQGHQGRRALSLPAPTAQTLQRVTQRP